MFAFLLFLINARVGPELSALHKLTHGLLSGTDQVVMIVEVMIMMGAKRELEEVWLLQLSC